MKKVALFIFLATAMVVCNGQGFVGFQNNNITLITTSSVSGGLASGPISGPGGYYFALFSAQAGTLDPNLFSFTGTSTTNRAFDPPGIFSGPAVAFPALTPVSLIVRAWSANIGPNYSDVTTYLLNPTFDAWYGQSQIATVTPTSGGFPPTPIFGTGGGRIPGFNLEMYSAVPEPSSVVLAILGAAVLFLFRRRARH